MKPIVQPKASAAHPPKTPVDENPTLDRKGPSAEQRSEQEKAELRMLLKAENRMGLYYQMYPLEAPEGYFSRGDEQVRSRGRGR